MQRRLKDETSGELDAPEVSGSLVELSVRLNLDAERLQTRAAARVRQTQTQAIIVCTPKSDEGGNNSSSSIQKTPFGEKSELESGSGNELET